MYTEVDKFGKEISVFAEETDMCNICANADICPLIGALENEAVVLRYENIEVENCPLYEEFRFELEESFPGQNKSNNKKLSR